MTMVSAVIADNHARLFYLSATNTKIFQISLGAFLLVPVENVNDSNRSCTK